VQHLGDVQAGECRVLGRLVEHGVAGDERGTKVLQPTKYG